MMVSAFVGYVWEGTFPFFFCNALHGDTGSSGCVCVRRRCA